MTGFATKVKQGVQFAARRAGYEIVAHPLRANPLWGHLQDVIAKFEIDAAIDVGAHHGLFVKELRKLGFAGPCLSVEPVPDNLRVLRESAASDPTWQVAECALGQTPTTTTFNVMRDTRFSSFHETTEWCQEWSDRGGEVESTIEVTVRRLDELCSATGFTDEAPRLLLKIDTQGSDIDVLESAEGILPLVHALQVELNAHPLYDNSGTDFIEAIARLREIGFELSHLTPSASTDELVALEFDCIFVRPQTSISDGMPESSDGATKR